MVDMTQQSSEGLNESYPPTIHWTIQFIYLIIKDTPLLDCVGLQYPRRDLTFYFSNRILRLVNLLSWLTRWPTYDF